MLELKNINFGYRKNQLLIKGFNGFFNKGEIVYVLGNNGIGKSTLLRLISNELQVTSGEILINGKANSSYTIKKLARYVSIIQDSYYTGNFKVFDYILFGRAPYIDLFSEPEQGDITLVDDTIRSMEIKNLEDRQMNTLSSGQRILVQIAQCFVKQSSIILLDEPFAALDFTNKTKVCEMIKNISKETQTLFMITSHNPNDAMQYADKVILFNDLGIFVDKKEKILTLENLRKTYNLDFEFLTGKNNIVINNLS